MKLVIALIVVVLFSNYKSTIVKATGGSNQFQLENLSDTLVRDTLIKFSAKPKLGFKFDYLVFLPKGLKRNSLIHLLVESTNTGANDTIEVHEKKARHAASRSSVGNYVAKKLKLPLLVPIFPRSVTDWMYYTHALDRETFLSQGRDIDRLDLQLLGMINDATQQLYNQKIKLKKKIFIVGFSASGTFANRFSLLHPEKIAATAAGGINSIAILPLAKLKGIALNYPLGIADLEKITGKRVKLTAFKMVPKLLFMGELDDNDAVAFDDAYSRHDREIVYSVMGKQMAERWNYIQATYQDNAVQADFRTYRNIGHGTDLKINNDIVSFFKKKVDK